MTKLADNLTLTKPLRTRERIVVFFRAGRGKPDKIRPLWNQHQQGTMNSAHSPDIACDGTKEPPRELIMKDVLVRRVDWKET